MKKRDNTNDEGLKAAYDAAERHNWTKEEYDEYIYAGMREQDARGELSFAVNKAVKEEVKREKYEVAKRCLDNGMSVETSAQISGLTIEEIEAIKRENA